ncbi:MAG: hopanoid biosynthesis associated radical SAM protein HpnJ [Elusimicrobia bacterium]|nr:hopanoid biosynthesis associated radical SAM protein HpnJ [Elusimicrobiota bacterium]MDE2424906.1 hopanoid biosynthesis associated radical SAM protein HpnJ [Elusimicrobiota bacterium]
MHKRTLFLNPPSFSGFDGGAGARYQARREIKSFWFPTWLAQPAALIPGSKLIDAPADDLSLEEVLKRAKGFELCVFHTSTPSFDNDCRVAQALKAQDPTIMIGFVGAHVAVLPEESLTACPAIDFVAREEFDYTLLEVAQGKPFSQVSGLSYREDGQVRHNPDRALIPDMDALPSVVDVYKRDLTIENYYIGYLKHPYLSLYTGRGCPARCTFCLWPQTVGGHVYRTRSAESVIAELTRAKALFAQVKEFFFDDDTFTADLPRAAAIARGLGRAGITWSCNSRANVPYEYLKIFKENGLRLLLVGYESGNQQILNNIKKGIRLDIAREFTRNCRKLGIIIHGTFILGLPGETEQTIEESIRFARKLDVETIQVSLAAAYPGTELYRQAMSNKWYDEKVLVRNDGTQASAIQYPHLSAAQIETGVKRFYSRFYARPRPILRMLAAMAKDPQERRRRLREGKEFLDYLRGRQKPPVAA